MLCCRQLVYFWNALTLLVVLERDGVERISLHVADDLSLVAVHFVTVGVSFRSRVRVRQPGVNGYL